MMKKANVLLSIGSAILASRVARAISDFQVDGVLGRVGLQRNRSHVAENLAYLGIGALVGAGTALLLAPDSGSNTRARIGRKIDELGDAAANAVEAVENHVPGLRSNQLAADRQHH